MKKLELYQSPVLFDVDRHDYTLNGEKLSGVTPIIAWLFPDTYKGIPKHILDQAAEYGTLIHKKCGGLSGVEGEQGTYDIGKRVPCE